MAGMTTEKQTAIKALRRELSGVQDNLYRCRLQVRATPDDERYRDYAREYEEREREIQAAMAWVESV